MCSLNRKVRGWEVESLKIVLVLGVTKLRLIELLLSTHCVICKILKQVYKHVEQIEATIFIISSSLLPTITYALAHDEAARILSLPQRKIKL